MDLHGVVTKSVEPIHTGSSKVDIFLELFDSPDGAVMGHVEYDSSLWQKSSIQSLVYAFQVSWLARCGMLPARCDILWLEKTWEKTQTSALL